MVQNANDSWKVLNSRGQILPIKVDSLVSGYYMNDFEKNELILSFGYMKGKKEFFAYPVYSNGKKMKLIAFKNQYALVSDTTDTRAIEMGEREVAQQNLKSIFITK